MSIQAPSEPVKVSTNVVSFNDGYWQWFFRIQRPDYQITGKYLFFSTDREKLVKIAIEELENNGFHEAKINMEGKKFGREYVLCLYYKDNSRKHELAKKYSNASGIKYRYWKSDIDTLSGKYSEEFLSRLSPEQRKRFTQSKLMKKKD
jgi:hypothetical protein